MSNKFVTNIKRVLTNGGRVDIINSRDVSLDITKEISGIIQYVEILEAENLELKRKIPDQKKISGLERYKTFVDELKLRRDILESNPGYSIKKNVKRLQKDKSDLFTQPSMSALESELIYIFEALEKAKLWKKLKIM